MFSQDAETKKEIDRQQEATAAAQAVWSADMLNDGGGILMIV